MQNERVGAKMKLDKVKEVLDAKVWTDITYADIEINAA